MSIQDELTVYRSLANREFTYIIEGAKLPDPNKFWEMNGQRLKQLNKLVRKFLISPATSVPSDSEVRSRHLAALLISLGNNVRDCLHKM
jgi:hypothetical protein